MFNHRHYVPVLKWKMGEYQALARLTDPAKDRLTPLLEIPPVGFDFETGRNKESADDHLGDFGKRLRSKWQSRRCFVDLKWLPPQTRALAVAIALTSSLTRHAPKAAPQSRSSVSPATRPSSLPSAASSAKIVAACAFAWASQTSTGQT